QKRTALPTLGSENCHFSGEDHRDLVFVPAHPGAGAADQPNAPKEPFGGAPMVTPSVGKLLLYIGHVKPRTQYIVLYFQMPRIRPKLLHFPSFTGLCRYFGVFSLVTLPVT